MRKPFPPFVYEGEIRSNETAMTKWTKRILLYFEAKEAGAKLVHRKRPPKTAKLPKNCSGNPSRSVRYQREREREKESVNQQQVSNHKSNRRKQRHGKPTRRNIATSRLSGLGHQDSST